MARQRRRHHFNRDASHFATTNRTFYTLQFKVDAVENAAHTSVRAAARAFGVSPRNIRRWRGSIQLLRVFPGNQRQQRLTLHTGPRILHEEVERLLRDWHTEKITVDNQGVTINQLMAKAIEFEPELGNMNRESLRSKIRRFMSRHDLVLRRVTSHIHRPNDDLEEAVNNFVHEVQDHITRFRVPQQNVFNMDQTAIYYEMPPNYTVVQRGASQNRILTRNQEKKRVSVLLGIRSDGVKLKPLIVYRGAPNATVNREVSDLDDDAAMHTVQRNAWTDLAVLTHWRNHILNEAVFNTEGPKLLLVDSYALHVDNERLLSCDRPDVDVKFVPRHCTGLIQPLDVSVIRAFKHRVRELMNNHDYENEEVTRNVLSNWIKQAWQAVPADLIRNSFNRLMDRNEEAMDLE